MKLDLSEQFLDSFSKMENTSKHLFITGRAGTGKSTLLTYFTENTNKNIACVAPTGVAALNINGMTIHNFFGFSIATTVDSAKKKNYQKDEQRRKVIKNLETLVIDEVSMVRADLFDCINEVLKNNGPHKGKLFGGVQMILIGDLYQLPPVVSRQDREAFEEFYQSPYFFSSNVFKEIELEILELTKIYRQKDVEFVSLLNKIRNNTVSYQELALINERWNEEAEVVDGSICLTPTNAQVEVINNDKLEKIDSDLYKVKALIKGNVPKEYYPAPLLLEYKKDAQVMMIRNSKKIVLDEDDNITSLFTMSMVHLVKLKILSKKNILITR